MDHGKNEARCIVAALKARDQLLGFKVVAKAVLGLPLMLVGPAALGTVFCYAAWSILGVYVPWTVWFGGLVLIMTPLLIRLEVRMGERFLSNAVRGADPWVTLTTRLPLYAGMGGALAPALANPRAVTAGITELLLTGPRLLVGAFRQWRFRQRLGKLDLRRAAELLCALRGRDQGLPLKVLPRPGETLDDLLPLLAWLAFDGWIGMGEKIDRVYLYSEARERLDRAVARPGVRA